MNTSVRYSVAIIQYQSQSDFTKTLVNQHTLTWEPVLVIVSLFSFFLLKVCSTGKICSKAEYTSYLLKYLTWQS